LYVDLILNAVPEALSRALKAMNLSNYQFKSEFARRYVNQGRAEGKAEGKVEGELEGQRKGRLELLTKLLTVKFGALPLAARARLMEASTAELDVMAERVLTSATLEEVLL
jgi:predicted transposase YdaD